MEYELLEQLMDLFNFKRHYQRETSGLKRLPKEILLAVGDNPGAKTLDLGRLLGIPPATLIGMLDDLERSGCVERIRSRADKRVVLVNATARGKAVIALHRREDELFVRNIVKGLEAAERKTLGELLRKMLKSIGDKSAVFKE